MNNEMRVVASWSGGIDSTAVVANLIKRGYDVTTVNLNFMPTRFTEREERARDAIYPHLRSIGGSRIETYEHDGHWLWEFSPDGKEIPRRNKHIMDYIITNHMIPDSITNIAMGEYTGADTWVNKSHVPANDCDHRALSAYLYMEYGMQYRLISLQDFGESRYKADRLKLGIDAIGLEAMRLTTNCLRDSITHCGECYKCQERRAAFTTLGIDDTTQYDTDPSKQPMYQAYLEQMKPVTTRKG